MPVFINEVVFRGDLRRPPEAATGEGSPVRQADREALVADVTQAVLDHLERALERRGER